jgi:hypothetical protein
MGNSLLPAVSNTVMGHFEEKTLDTRDYKPIKWLRYIDDTSVVWPHGPARLQLLFHYLSSIRPTIKFKMEVEVNDTFLFLKFLVMKKDPTLATKVYRKSTHTCSDILFKCSHSNRMKLGVVYS